MPSPHPPPRKLHILCVDDEPAIREVLRLLLTREGHSVEMASDGEAAWDMVRFRLSQVDVVVTDNEMPHLSGVSLVERLRNAGFAGPVVFFCASIQPETADVLKHLGVSALVPKGTAADDLLRVIRRLASRP